MSGERTVRWSRIDRVYQHTILPAVYGAHVGLGIEAWHAPGEPVPYAVAEAADFAPFGIGQPWGPLWGTSWFRLSGQVPADWAGQEVVARLNFGHVDAATYAGEALVWEHGVPSQGINPGRSDYRIARPAVGGEPVLLHVEAAANATSLPQALFDQRDWPLLMPEPDGAPQFEIRQADLAVFHRDVWDYSHDYRVLMELVEQLPADSTRGALVFAALDASCRLLDREDVLGTVAAAREPLREALAQPAGGVTHQVSAVGHAHLDTAWLWPLRETKRKAARTFSNAVRLMEDYPEFHFVASQAVQYAWVKQDHPALFERIRERVKSGQFEPVGGMWVESDCNIPSGESLVRQLVHGKRFFLEEFDYEPRDVWIPDVFGYPGCLPQIIREAGSEYFLTQKMSWNDTNRFPHNSFWWEGIDGSRVFAHFPPADTYIGVMSVEELRGSERRFAQHAVSQRSLYAFGHGDGGGGATAEMLESARRLADTDGSPRIHLESALEFFQKATAEAGELPVWTGELYAEFHRGTYTSQGRTKRNNRKCEQLLAATELWCAVAALTGASYPTAELDAAWKLLLLQQFHDVIPGTGIHWVYEDTERDYAELRSLVEPKKQQAQELIAASIDTAGWTRPVVLFNQVAHERRELVQVDAGTSPAAARSASGELLPVQRLRDGSALFPAQVPACGHAAYDLIDALPASESAPAVDSPVTVSGNTMSNGLVTVAWDEQGHVTSLVDETSGRDAIPSGERGNLFQLFQDYPNSFDAWDIDLTYTERSEDLVDVDVVEVVETGPLRAAVRIVRSFGDSRIEQVMRLDVGAAHVVFDTEVDWHESQRLLKVGFPVAVRAQRATYDIQHGHVERPTHTNTSWDQARFEVCAHQWADLAEPGFGLALINDCKYGYDATSNRLRLSLLRSSTAPDPLADRGHNVFSYAVLPHSGDLRDAGVVELGLAFNAPLDAVLTAAVGGDVLVSSSHLTIDGAGAVVDAVKKPDEGDGLVVRLHEAYGGHRSVRLSAERPIRSAVRTDLLERPVEELDVHDGAVQLDLTPFQLRTVRLGF